MHSIRNFLIVLLLAIITLAIFTASLHGYRNSMDKAEELFDRQLKDFAVLLTSVEFNTATRQILDDESKAIQVWTREGVLAIRSAQVPETKIADLKVGYSYSNFKGLRWRVYVHQSRRDMSWIMVGEPINLRFTLAEAVILDSVIPIVLIIPILGLMIWGVVGKGLLPLGKLAQQLTAKQSDDLVPISVANQPVELLTVTQSINALMMRLSDAFDRERRFASDAAHELRTPISVLKVQLHNLSQTLPKNLEGLDGLKQGVDRMEHLVEQILALYRSSPEQLKSEFTKVDIYRLAQDVIGRVYDEIAEKEQQIELVGSSAWVIGDEFALETLLKNLISNAIKYTPCKGEILVEVKPVSFGVLLKVDDSGPGIPENLRHRVFERFYRVGGDHHNSGVVGCGLGLSIVQHIATVHGATLTLGDSRFDKGLSVKVSFPEQSGRLHEDFA